jgi:hypothetical protein
MIRLLTLFDLDSAMKIARLKLRSGGTTTLSDTTFEQLHYRYFESNGINYALGYFDNDQLVSWIALGLHENKTRGRFWYISFLYTSVFHNSFTFNNIEIGSLIKSAFAIAEEQQYYEYYYTVAQRIEHVYDRQWARNNFMQTGRYDCTVIGQVEANTTPTVDLYWRLLGCETRPDTLVIKKRVLRPEFRK